MFTERVFRILRFGASFDGESGILEACPFTGNSLKILETWLLSINIPNSRKLLTLLIHPTRETYAVANSAYDLISDYSQGELHDDHVETCRAQLVLGSG